jgi:hypothetical protein
MKRTAVQSQPEQMVPETISLKNPSQKRGGGVAQGMALTSNPSTTKINKYLLIDVTKTHGEHQKRT